MSRKQLPIEVARVYDAPAVTGRYRVLVDRLWPRGVRRADLALDEWLREIAPSDDLRRWFGHDIARWDEFRSRYGAELAAQPDLVNHLLDVGKERGLLLLFAARDEDHNNAVALKEFLQSQAATRHVRRRH